MIHQAITAICARRRARLFAMVALATLAGVFGVQAHHKANRPIGYDVHAYLDAGEAIAAGENPYRVDRPIWCVYPPFFAMAAIALTWVPRSAVHAVWFFANIGALTLVLKIVATQSQPFTGIASNRHALVPLATAVFLLIGPIQNHLLNGQCNLLILLVCLAFWLAHERGRSARAGFYLALGVSLKLVPGIFVPLLFARRSWRTLGWTVLFGAVLSLLPAVFLGWRLPEVYRYYFDVVLLGEARTGAFSDLHPHDFTAAGFLFWLVPAWTGSLAARGAAAALVIFALLAADARRNRLLPAVAAQGFWTWSSFPAAILMISPMSETHHLVYLLPAAAMITLKLVGQPAWATRWRVVGFLLAIGLLYAGKGLDVPLQFVAIAGVFAVCQYESTRPIGAAPECLAASSAMPGPPGGVTLPHGGAAVWRRAS